MQLRKTKLGIRRAVILLLSLFVAPAFCVAANHYVRTGATGNGSGNDWTNASTSLPEILIRGDTYYIADGSYGSYTFNDAVSGTTLIFIKKATIADHGTDVGWQNTFGDGSADFTNWNFTTSYWEADGQAGQWADTLYGVPAVPGFVPYGFRVRKTTTANLDFLIRVGSLGNGANNITLRHVEAGYTNTPKVPGNWGNDQTIASIIGNNNTLSYCWLHDAGLLNLGVEEANNLLVEYCVLERNGQADVAEGNGEHSEIYAATTTAMDNHIFRYNVIRDWRSTGGLILHTANNPGAGITNFKVYGNVFTTTGYFPAPSEGEDANGVIGAESNSGPHTAFVYNNTFVNITYGTLVLAIGTYNARQIRNNIFYSARTCNPSGGSCLGAGAQLGAGHDYNWFFDSGTQSESNIQNGTGDPFVDLPNGNYHLAAATDAGDTTIGNEFGTDPDGVTRGADGIWDRGAFEFQSNVARPAPPLNLRAIVQ